MSNRALRLIFARAADGLPLASSRRHERHGSSPRRAPRRVDVSLTAARSAAAARRAARRSHRRPRLRACEPDRESRRRRAGRSSCHPKRSRTAARRSRGEPRARRGRARARVVGLGRRRSSPRSRRAPWCAARRARAERRGRRRRRPAWRAARARAARRARGQRGRACSARRTASLTREAKSRGGRVAAQSPRTWSPPRSPRSRRAQVRRSSRCASIVDAAGDALPMRRGALDRRARARRAWRAALAAAFSRRSGACSGLLAQRYRAARRALDRARGARRGASVSAPPADPSAAGLAMSSLADRIGRCSPRWVDRRAAPRRQTSSLALLAARRSPRWYAARNLGVNTDTANMISAELPWRQNFIEFRDAFPGPRPQSPDRDRRAVARARGRVRRRAARGAAARARPLPFDLAWPGDGEFFERNGLLYLPLSNSSSWPTASPRRSRCSACSKAVRRRGRARGSDTHARAVEADVRRRSAALAPFHRGARGARSTRHARARARALAWNELLGGERRAEPRGASSCCSLRSTSQACSRHARRWPESARSLPALNAREPHRPCECVSPGSVAMEHEELAEREPRGGLGAHRDAAHGVRSCCTRRCARGGSSSSPSLTLVAGLPLTAAFAAAAVGHLNLLSIAFVVLNVGLGSDYVIHVLLAAEGAHGGGHAADEALIETMRGVGASLVLCAVTTAAGFYSFIPTQFEGVSELGLIAGTGVFFGLIVSVHALPALVAQFVTGDDRERDARTLGQPAHLRAAESPAARGARRDARARAAHVRRVAAGDVRQQPDPPARSEIGVRDDAARARRGGRCPVAELVAVAPDRATALDWSAKLARCRSSAA